jgi:hypothetical protein
MSTMSLRSLDERARQVRSKLGMNGVHYGVITMNLLAADIMLLESKVGIRGSPVAGTSLRDLLSRMNMIESTLGLGEFESFDTKAGQIWKLIEYVLANVRALRSWLTRILS